MRAGTEGEKAARAETATATARPRPLTARLSPPCAIQPSPQPPDPGPAPSPEPGLMRRHPGSPQDQGHCLPGQAGAGAIFSVSG